MPFPAPADRSALPGPSSGRRAPATSSHRTQFCIVSIRRPQRHRSRARSGRYHLSGEGGEVPHTRAHAARSVPGRLGRRYSLLRVFSSPEGRPPSTGAGNTSSTASHPLTTLIQHIGSSSLSSRPSSTLHSHHRRRSGTSSGWTTSRPRSRSRGSSITEVPKQVRKIAERLGLDIFPNM